MPITKTTAASTAFGMYCERLRQEEQDDRDDGRHREHRDLAARLRLLRHLRLRRAAVDDERAAEAGGEVRGAEADEVGVLLEVLLVLDRVRAGGRGALGDDDEEHRDAGREQRPDVVPADAAREADEGRPLGTVPSVETPWDSRSKPQLIAIEPTTATRPPGIIGIHFSNTTRVAITPSETASVAPDVWGISFSVSQNLTTVPLSWSRSTSARARRACPRTGPSPPGCRRP